MRTAMIALLLLTTGCATQSGIVDGFAPPPAQPTVPAQQVVCAPPVEGSTVAAVAPCVVQVVALAAAKTTRPAARRPLPPRRLK